MQWDIGVRVKNIYPSGFGRGITPSFWHGYARRSRALHDCSGPGKHIVFLSLFQAASLLARSAAISHIA